MNNTYPGENIVATYLSFYLLIYTHAAPVEYIITINSLQCNTGQLPTHVEKNKARAHTINISLSIFHRQQTIIRVTPVRVQHITS